MRLDLITWLAQAVQAAIIAIAFLLAIFVFRLGWFFPIVAAVGAGVAVLGAGRWRGQRGNRAAAKVVALVSYTLVFATLVWTCVGQRSERTLRAAWHDRGADNSFQEAEVFLEFVDFPGHGVGVYSTALRDQLAEVGTESIQIDFVVTADLGCVRGFHHVRIGHLADSAVINGRGGYAQGGHSGASPWRSDLWWCR